jgi:hypothetical protein
MRILVIPQRRELHVPKMIGSGVALHAFVE